MANEYNYGKYEVPKKITGIGAFGDIVVTELTPAVDNSATAIAGGEKIAVDANGFLSLTDQNISIVPGDILSIVIEPTGTPADYVASISWREDL